MSSIKDLNFKNWRPKVVVTQNDVPESGLKLLRKKCDVTICESNNRVQVLEKIKGADAIFWAHHDELNSEVLNCAGSQLKCISTMSVGLDHVDVGEIKRRKILLGYAPNVVNDAVAEIGVGLAIAAGRRFHEGRLAIEKSNWEMGQQWMLGHELKGSTVGIVGFGGIGATLAKKLSAFNVKKFLYCGHTQKPKAEEFNAKFVSFDELVKESDFIFITCPLTDKTRNMFKSETFAQMKPSSVLINIARGDIINQDDLYDALSERKIFAAGIDVTTPEPIPADHKLLTSPNCIIIPHLGSATFKSRSDACSMAAMNILLAFAGEKMIEEA